MNEHTPGPWRWITEDGYWDELVGAGGERVLDDGSAGGEYGARIEPDSPNGRLVAASPDLLAACEAAYAWLGRFGVHAPTVVGGEAELAEQLRAAIAKVRG